MCLGFVYDVHTTISLLWWEIQSNTSEIPHAALNLPEIL